jgi:hypothetical protein
MTGATAFSTPLAAWQEIPGRYGCSPRVVEAAILQVTAGRQAVKLRDGQDNSSNKLFKNW